MKEQFKTAMVYCAAVAVFYGGANIAVEGLSSMQANQVAAVVQKLNSQESSPDSSTADAAATGVKKVLKSLLK